jgi:DNA-directed RNA polymerase specialized sigma subunit, sigma24 homolog
MNSSVQTIENCISPKMHTASTARRKWVLTQDAFDRLLATLDEDRDTAGERYLEIRSNLIRFFQWRGAPFPEDHADETINRIAKRIWEKEEIRNPGSYYLGVARMLLLEINRERVREQHALAEMPFSVLSSVESDDFDERIDSLRNCLQHLSDENRQLILQYYHGEKAEKIESRRQLSERLGISVNTLRMRALRIREELQRCAENHHEHCRSMS